MGLFSFLFGSKKEEPVKVEESVSNAEHDVNAVLRAQALMAMFNDQSVDNEKATKEEIEAYVDAYIKKATQPIEPVTFRHSAYSYKVAGINMRGDLSPYVVYTFEEGIPCRLIEEPDNEYDSKAIRIEIAQNGHHVGYVAKDDQDEVRAICENEFPYDTYVNIQEHVDDDGRFFYVGTYWV